MARDSRHYRRREYGEIRAGIAENDNGTSRVPLLLIPVFVILAAIVLIPVGIVRRYRVGTSRQRARGWLTTLNLVGLALSCALFVAFAALTNTWVPDALSYTGTGLGAGAALGIVGLWLTRW